jgi:apolipoprotein N-acyltransferase
MTVTYVVKDPRWKTRIGLALLSGVLLGISFPPFPTGACAAIAFAPFFILFEDVVEYGKALRLSYLVFLVFNLIALYWTGGFTHAKDWYLMTAGLAVLAFHPMFFWATILPFIFIRKRLGFNAAVLAFPFIWVGYDYFRSLTEYSFPWLTLGNTQTYNLASIQIAEYTGVYGLSFWLLVLNVLLYFLATNVVRKKWGLISGKSISFALILVVVYALPHVIGNSILNRGQHAEPAEQKPLRVGIVQPNIDPFEKWTGDTEGEIALQDSMTVEAARKGAKLVLWSETAVPEGILEPSHEDHLRMLRRLVDTLHIDLMTGMIDYLVYSTNGPYPKSSKTSVNGIRFDAFNSSLLLRWDTPQIQKYDKIHLVPYAERVPYSEFLSFLNAMQWNFGIGGWGIGKDTAIFTIRDSTGISRSFANMICYESIYPDFVRQFVLRGAQFITVITNDSWWGNTSGAYQHKQYGILRAIENRRWVVQCANGGISCIIDPYGNIMRQTDMYSRTVMTGDIYPRSDVTFYTKHGDMVPQFCLAITGVFLLGGMFTVKRKKNIPT